MSRTAVSVRNVDRYIHQMSFHIAQHDCFLDVTPQRPGSTLPAPAPPVPPRCRTARRVWK